MVLHGCVTHSILKISSCNSPNFFSLLSRIPPLLLKSWLSLLSLICKYGNVVGASSALERCIKIDASDDGMFIPRLTITLKVEGTSLQLYPPADPSWKTAEKDYAFKVNVSACERACLTPLTSITHDFHQMGMTTQGNMEVATWTNPLEDHWANPSSILMHILGYFDSSGNRIYDAEDANGSLEDIGDSVHMDDMRPPDINFVTFCFDHDCSDLTQPGIPQEHSKLVWFIPLPVEQVVSTDDAGVVFSRVTFAVPGQISTMSEATFRSQVLNPLGSIGPVGLQPSTPPALADLTDDHVMQKLQNVLLRNAQPHIYAALRAVICPNFNTAPEAMPLAMRKSSPSCRVSLSSHFVCHSLLRLYSLALQCCSALRQQPRTYHQDAAHR